MKHQTKTPVSDEALTTKLNQILYDDLNLRKELTESKNAVPNVRFSAASLLSFSVGPWLAAAISFFTAPIVARLLAPEELGKAQMFTIAQSLLFSTLLIGSDQFFLRTFFEKEEHDRERLLSICLIPSLFLILCVAAISFPFWPRIAFVIFDDRNILPIFLLLISVLLAILISFGNGLLRLTGSGKLFSFISLITCVSNTLGIITAFTFEKKFLVTIYALIFSQTITLAILTHLNKKYIKFNRCFSVKDFLPVMYFGIPFLPNVLFYWISQSSDKIMVNSLISTFDLGQYSVALKIVAAISILQSGFSTYWLPTAYANYNSKDVFDQYLKDSFELVMLVSFLGAAGVLAFSPIILALFGAKYSSAIQIVPFLLFAPIMYMGGIVSSVSITTSKKTAWLILINLSAAITSILGNYFLIKILGIKGAAITVAVSNTVMFCTATYIAFKIGKTNLNIFRFARLCIAFAITCYFHSFDPSLYMKIISTTSCIGYIFIECRAQTSKIFDKIQSFLISKWASSIEN